MDWRLTSFEASVPVLTRAVHLYGDKGYQLAGISGHDGLLWLLVERPPDDLRSSAVVSVRFADLGAEEAHRRISRAVESARGLGWQLAGLATTVDTLHFAVVPDRGRSAALGSSGALRYSWRMRTVFIITALAIAVSLPAQEWALQRLTSTDELREVTDTRVLEGYTPVGIDIGDELGLSMLYAKPAVWQATSYAIVELDSLDELNSVVTDRIRSGWFPMDFTIHDGTHAFVFTDSADVISGWRVVGSDPSFVEVQRTIGRYERDGFTPVGISATDDGQLAVLLLNLPERDPFNSMVVGVAPDPEQVTVLVQSMVDEGWTPMSVTAAPTELVMLFLRV